MVTIETIEIEQNSPEWTSISLKQPLRKELQRLKAERDADTYDSLLRSELELEETTDQSG